MIDLISGNFHYWYGSPQEVLDNISANADRITIISVSPEQVKEDSLCAIVRFN